MTTKFEQELYMAACERISEMEFDDAEFEFIFADWDNWDDHIRWLLVADRDEIQDWIDAAN